MNVHKELMDILLMNPHARIGGHRGIKYELTNRGYSVKEIDNALKQNIITKDEVLSK